MIPAWLAARIGDAFRTARLGLCPRCKAPVLAGLDDDTAARTVRADPTPITPLGETLALLANRATFDFADFNGKRLWRRDEWQIGTARRYPVLAEHACGQPLTAHAEPTPARARYVCPDEPEF